MATTSAPQVLMGFDFGQKRTGVAVGQSLTGTANGVTTLACKQGKPNWQVLDALVEEWKPDAFVVGIPVHMDGTEQDMTKAAKKFANRLNGRYNLKIFEAEERLSSMEAEQNLGANPKPEEIDREAARLILEAWLSTSDR